jgi:hypothetical protein
MKKMKKKKKKTIVEDLVYPRGGEGLKFLCLHFQGSNLG